MTCANTFRFFERCFSFGIRLVLTGAAVVWAMTHLDFVCLPVNFGVMFVKPVKSENDVLLA
jgi:hypothetical protein